MADKITAKDLLKTEGIITANPTDTLGQALAKLISSHDAVFVKDKKDQLLGVISPYHVLYRTSHPPTTKLINCLFSPPKLKEYSPISEIARNMLESKIYYLPVFSENNRWLGIVSVRTLLRSISANKEIIGNLSLPKRKEIYTLPESATLKEAKFLLGQKGVARLPVVNQSGKLVGILTRYELGEALSLPKDSLRNLSRVGEKKKMGDKSIRSFYIKSVVTASEKQSIAQMISQILEKRVGSIVIVNSKWQPVNILTTSDLLKSISKKGQPQKTNIIISTHKDFRFQKELKSELDRLINKLKKLGVLSELKFDLTIIGSTDSKRNLYAVNLQANYLDKNAFNASAQNFDWKKTIKSASKKLKKQLS